MAKGMVMDRKRREPIPGRAANMLETTTPASIKRIGLV
jgi:hypothetical protein